MSGLSQSWRGDWERLTRVGPLYLPWHQIREFFRCLGEVKHWCGEVISAVLSHQLPNREDSRVSFPGTVPYGDSDGEENQTIKT